jgi:SAM-dependent methyltransferase
LKCEDCGDEYPISKGIPRILIGQLPDAVHRTVVGFGWEWETFNDIIQDTYMTNKSNFFDFIHPVSEDFFEDKFVLDAGCGMGRFLRLGAEFGSRDIIGVDLSKSVDAAYANTRALPNAHVVQADIFALPFIVKFDYIFSIGVLQFLFDPQKGFSELIKVLKAGGSISVWVYSKENNGWIIRLLSPLRQYITSRLPRPVLYLFSSVVGAFLYICIKLIYKPANEWNLGVDLGSWLPYNDYLYYISQLTYSSLVSVIFDHLVPQIVVYLSKDELEAWFLEEGISSVVITSRNNMSWRGLGTLATSQGTA